MKFSRSFALTTREQRAIIIIVIALVAGSVAIHYHDLRDPMPAEKPATATPPAEIQTEEASPAPDESTD